MSKTMTYKLLREWDLLELHLVDAGGGGAQQRAGGKEDGRLHGEFIKAEAFGTKEATKNEQRREGIPKS